MPFTPTETPTPDLEKLKRNGPAARGADSIRFPPPNFVSTHRHRINERENAIGIDGIAPSFLHAAILADQCDRVAGRGQSQFMAQDRAVASYSYELDVIVRKGTFSSLKGGNLLLKTGIVGLISNDDQGPLLPQKPSEWIKSCSLRD
jgi:hypothetical protein